MGLCKMQLYECMDPNGYTLVTIEALEEKCFVVTSNSNTPSTHHQVCTCGEPRR